MGEEPYRVLPRVSDVTEHFWRGGRDGELRILRCDDCGFWIHPPVPRCPRCLSTAVTPRATSGRGVVHSFTINHKEWNPTLPDRYVVAIVELEDQEGLRLLTDIVDCEPDTVSIGLPVEVTFAQHDDVWIPLFAPSAGA